MLRSFFIVFFYFCLASSFAQVKLPAKENQNKATVKETPSKTSEVRPASSGQVLTLKIICNADCKFYIDGELKATLAKDDIVKMPCKAGEYQFKAVSTLNNSAIFKEIHKVNKEEIGTEKFYEIDLQSIIDERVQQENRERAASEKIAAENKIAREREAKEEAERLARKKEAEAKAATAKQLEEERIAKEKKQADERAAEEKQLEQSPILKEEKDAEEKNATTQQTEKEQIFTAKNGEQYNRWGQRVNIVETNAANSETKKVELEKLKESFEAEQVLLSEDVRKKRMAEIATKEKEINKPETENAQVYTTVDEMPVFPGGDAALMNFIAGNVKYPAEELRNGIQGKVFIQFVVAENGTVQDVKLLKGVNKAFDEEALRVVSILPAFNPGKQNGKPVKVSYTLPISFKLK